MKIKSALNLLIFFIISSPLFAIDSPHFYSSEFMDSEDEHIMMDYTSIHVPSKDKTYYECLVWDSKTGKSKLYYYDYTDKAFKAYGSNVQFPANPLPNCSNPSPRYFMDYSSVHVPSEDKTYYECMVWDAITGASQLYYYDYTDKVFKAYQNNAQLPDNPLPEVQGSRNLRMNYTSVYVPTEDKTYYECMVWDTKTGTSKLYFYDYTEKSFLAYNLNVQLPKNPLPNASAASNASTNQKGGGGGTVTYSIYMDYTAIYVPSEDKTYYECLVWDTKSGVSLLYYYDYDTKGFKAYSETVQMPKKPLGDQTVANNSIYMDYSSVYIPSKDKTYYECLVWDTKTGNSLLYYYDYTEKTFIPYNSNAQIPAKPIYVPSDSFIMMNYTSVYIPTQEKTYYECIVWNPDTGESILYYYDYTSKTFIPYEDNVQLPSSPLK